MTPTDRPTDRAFTGAVAALQGDIPAQRPAPLWRDPANPAEQALTPADRLAYRDEQEDL